MSEDKTIQMPQTAELKPPHSDLPPTAPPTPRGGMVWYVVALILAMVVAAGAGVFWGTNTEGSQAKETLDAITQAAGEQAQFSQETAVAGTAIVEAFTATPTLTATPTDTPTSTATATPEIPLGQVLPFSIAVYREPLTTAAIALMLNQDTLVQITAITEDNTWFKVIYPTEGGGKATGYISVGDLRIIGGAISGVEIAALPTETRLPPPTMTLLPTATPATPEAYIVPVSVPVYSGPSADFELVGNALQDTNIELVGLSEDGQWVAIVYQDRNDMPINGYVLLESVRITGGVFSSLAVISMPETTPSKPIAISSGALFAVRIGPDRQFEAVGILGQGDSLAINALSPDGLWFQVDYPASPTGLGWISAESVVASGDFQQLPVVQGPLLPTSTPITVVIQGGGGTETTLPPQDLPNVNDLALVPLPSRTTFNLNNVPDLDNYAYEVSIAIAGRGDGQDYTTFLSIILSASVDPNQSKLIIDGSGELDDIDPELIDFFPITIGMYQGQNYVYTSDDEFCLPIDEEFGIDDILSDLPSALENGGSELIGTLNQLGAFAIIEDDGILGLRGNHYRFLGYKTESNFNPTSDIKADLWWTEDNAVLYGFDMTFVFGPTSNVGIDLLNALDPNVRNFTTFEGTANIHAFPVAVNEQAVNFTAPPEACDPYLN